MTPKTIAIRMLTDQDVTAFLEHNVRNELTSKGDQIFSAFSSREASPFNQRVESTKRQWAILIDQQGWT